MYTPTFCELSCIACFAIAALYLALGLAGGEAYVAAGVVLFALINDFTDE